MTLEEIENINLSLNAQTFPITHWQYNKQLLAHILDYFPRYSSVIGLNKLDSWVLEISFHANCNYYHRCTHYPIHAQYQHIKRPLYGRRLVRNGNTFAVACIQPEQPIKLRVKMIKKKVEARLQLSMLTNICCFCCCHSI